MQNHLDKLEYLTNCLYCNSSDFSKLLSAPDRFSEREEIFTAVKCSNCGLVFQNPRVKEEYIGEYYGEGDDLGYYRVPTQKTKTLFSKIKTLINKQVLTQYFNYKNLGKKNIFNKIIFLPFKRFQKIRMMPTFVENGTVLEIGCSHGEHLNVLKTHGWKVKGLEMSTKMVEHAQSIGLDVSASRIEDASFEPNSFNVVTMSMVLEHLHDPLGNLVRITNWLKPKGQLIFSIPYIEGVEFKIFKEYTYALQLPHHITLMNKKIMREYLTKLGYKNIKFYFQFFDRDVVTSAQWKYVATQKYIYKMLGYNKLVRYLFIKPSLLLLSLFDKTSRVTVYAEKV